VCCSKPGPVVGPFTRKMLRMEITHDNVATNLRRLLAVGLLFGGVCAGAVGDVSAQDAEGSDLTGLFRGVVRDEVSGMPLEGARVRLVDLARGTLTDSVGAFVIAEVPTGLHVVTAEQYGFDGLGISIDVTRELLPPFEIRLNPRPVMLDGLTVVADRLAEIKGRLQSRRRAVPSSTRAFEQDRLLRTGAVDMVEFLQFDASLMVVPCGMGVRSSRCLIRRGRVVEPRVYIDEMPAFGALDQLESYRPHELYLVEVYSRGQEIRAYTHRFMERMARRPMALIPFGAGI
jgi:hypothetical protein